MHIDDSASTSTAAISRGFWVGADSVLAGFTFAIRLGSGFTVVFKTVGIKNARSCVMFISLNGLV